MKFLCVCDGGNVRSAALALALKEYHQQEAIAVGRVRTSKESMDTFCEWADLVIILQPHMEESIDPKFKPKLRCVDVGPDNYGMYVHPQLLPMITAGANWLMGKQQ